jgi:hypothetical protein
MTLSIDIPDNQATRVGDAFDALFPGRVAAGLTKAQWVKQQTMHWIKTRVRNYEASRDGKTAENAAAASVESGVTLT